MRQFEAQKIVKTKQTLESEDAPVSNTKQDYLLKKETEKNARKLKSMVDKSEKRISELETELSEIQDKLSKPENQTDMTLFQQFDKIKADLDLEMENWEKASKDYDDFICKIQQ